MSVESNVDFYQLGHALANLHAVRAAHVLLDVLGKHVACHTDALVGDDAAKRDYRNLSCTAAYVDNHIAFRCLDVETDTEGCCHRLVNHINVAAAGMLARVADCTDFNLGAARRDTHHDAQRRREPMVFRAYHLDKSADHQLGGVEVGDNAVAQRADGADARVLLSLHHLSLFSYGNKLAFGVESHIRRLVDHDLVIVDDDRVCRSKVNGYFLCQ